MYLIAHRGNLSGSEPDKENTPDYIDAAIERGYDVEIDVQYRGNNFYLGHDADIETHYPIDRDFLMERRKRLWCHAKSIPALYQMKRSGIHCFWHERDNVTLTSKGYLWTFPGRELTAYSIVVLPEKYLKDWYMNPGRISQTISRRCAGICSDDISIIKPPRRKK